MTQAVLDEPTTRPDPDPAVGLGAGGSDDFATVLRRGQGDDAAALIAMHARCSVDTIQRRYHTAMPRLSPRLAHMLLSPVHGWSVVMTSGPALVGIGTLARDHDGQYEVGLLVEDRLQQQGVGARLLHALARQATDQGIDRLTLFIQPGNHAMLATIRRAGLNARITTVDGLLRASIPIATMRSSSRAPQQDPDGPDHEPARSAATCTRATTGNPPTPAAHRPRYDCPARHRPGMSRGHRQPMTS